MPGKELQNPLNRRLGGFQSQSGQFGEKSLAPTGIRTADPPASSLVTIRLCCSGPLKTFCMTEIYNLKKKNYSQLTWSILSGSPAILLQI